MKNLIITLACYAFSVGLPSCIQRNETESNQVLRVAFMADVHLQDIYGQLNDSNYEGVINPTTGKHMLPRTMQSQLNSTRIFNENYFAFLAALDDVANRGIKYVVLPGDFSDDGQPINIRGLKRILNQYTQKYGIRFIATTGNHDPVRPFTIESGKTDFLGVNGKKQAIMSKEGLHVASSNDLPIIISKDFCKLGYSEIITNLSSFGFDPLPNDLYWATPFSKYTPDNYSFTKAKESANLEKRKYSIKDIRIPDVSYVVEPEAGIWFLAIDANVYIPTIEDLNYASNPANFKSASIGYNNVLTHKNHIFEWISRVTTEANKRGKKLIVFSHYPMIDFNDDASDHIKKLFGADKMQLHRVPHENIAKLFAQAGVRVHFGGHMHINDTGVRKFEDSTGLINIQIPSLAAYIPAYKVATISDNFKMHIQTVQLDSVPRFDELFPLYLQEHAFLSSIGDKGIWNKEILSSKSYHEFTNWHLKELVRLRFINNDWPDEIKEFLLNSTGKDILKVALTDVKREYTIDIEKLKEWTGSEMIFDLYRVRSADKLAFKDIGQDRIKQYHIVLEALLKLESSIENKQLHKDLLEFANIFHDFMNGMPVDNFTIDLKSGNIENLNELSNYN